MKKREGLIIWVFLIFFLTISIFPLIKSDLEYFENQSYNDLDIDDLTNFTLELNSYPEITNYSETNPLLELDNNPFSVLGITQNSIGLFIDWIFPTSGIEVNQTELFNISVNISCLGMNCGEVNISLDPESQNIYNFTSCGATGRIGPNQTQCNTNYSGTNLDGKITIIENGTQKWVVPATGIYTIEAIGAGGAVMMLEEHM